MLHRIVVAVVLLLVCEAAAETPMIIPRPHVVVVLNGTYTAAAVVTFSCAEVYQTDFRNSFAEIIGRANDAIERGQLCVGSLVNAVTGDISSFVSGTVTKVDFAVAIFPSDSNSIRGVEICSYDVQGYLQTYSNWRQPIIYGTGCPSVTFTPQAFDWVNSDWGCLES